MKEPTQKQLKEFWEWCGFKYLGKHMNYNYADDIEPEQDLWEWPEGLRYFALPGIGSLDNLFKYAVPKLPTWDCIIDWAIEMIHAYADGRVKKDPALALFWAIWKVINE